MPDRQVPMIRYLAKLTARGALSVEAQSALLALPGKTETVEHYRDLVREGEASRRCCLVVEGLVSRYKTLRSGGRQILSFHIPGDMVDLTSCLLKFVDYGIRTHVPTTVQTYDHDDILRLAAQYPDLGRSLWFDTLVDGAIFREWTVNVGSRSGRQRIAHLLLEFAHRLCRIGQSDGETFTLSVTQTDLADAVGLSPVHVNRSLQALRSDGLIRTMGRTVTLLDPARLADEADFNDLYLHPEGPRQLRG